MADILAFNAAPADAAERDLLAACGSTAFATAVLAGRPYPDTVALFAAIDAAFEELNWDDILEAMSAHPRIGGDGGAEQAGVTDADRQALADGNTAYERRFGHVFLIRASGRSGQDMLTELHRRLKNDEISERAVATRELRDITRLRMAKLLSS